MYEMDAPQLAGEAFALYNFVQAQLRRANDDLTASRTSLQSVEANDAVRRRFATTDQGMNELNQKIDATAQTIETKLNTLQGVVASGDPRGEPRQKDTT